MCRHLHGLGHRLLRGKLGRGRLGLGRSLGPGCRRRCCCCRRRRLAVVVREVVRVIEVALACRLHLLAHALRARSCSAGGASAAAAAAAAATAAAAAAHVVVEFLMADRPCGGWRRVPERERERERLLHLLLRLLRLLLLRVIRHRGEA